MEIRSGLEGLNSLLGVNAPESQGSQGRSQGTAQFSLPGSDSATLSSTASEMAQSAGSDDVNMDKVSAVQAALANGTYGVPASAVASKMVDAMLAGQ